MAAVGSQFAKLIFLCEISFIIGEFKDNLRRPPNFQANWLPVLTFTDNIYHERRNLVQNWKARKWAKGSRILELNCSLLADDAYVNSVTELLPIWVAEGRKELSDHQSIWDWIKYSIRAHAINFSKRKSNERNEKEKTLQEELSKAKEELEMTPSDLNASRYQAAQENLEAYSGTLSRLKSP